MHSALLAHGSTYIGGVLNRDNWFYIPPELLLESRHDSNGAKRGEWICQQILHVLDAEQIRDKALTALKKSEADQRRLAEQLAEMNRTLERRVTERTRELELANRHLEAFSYSVSHDLRAPLRSISAFSEILSEEFSEPLGEEGRKHLDRVRASAVRMGELIDGLLTLGCVTRAELNRSTVDLSLVAQEVAGEIRESEPQRSAQFVISSNLRTVGDSTLLRAVLVNLLGNAWKFTSKRACAEIEIGKTEDERGQTVFFVKDNGAGFEMKYAQKLFGVFQLMHQQDEFPGTGVGLATVQRIIMKHGGRIWAESIPDRDATFFFTLPGEGLDLKRTSVA